MHYGKWEPYQLLIGWKCIMGNENFDRIVMHYGKWVLHQPLTDWKLSLGMGTSPCEVLSPLSICIVCVYIVFFYETAEPFEMKLNCHCIVFCTLQYFTLVTHWATDSEIIVTCLFISNLIRFAAFGWHALFALVWYSIGPEN